MKFEQRSYGGKIFRPTPEVHIEADGGFGIIATPWGSQLGARKVIDLLRDFSLSARQDVEVTSPFQKLSCLTPLANNLRAGLMLANDSLYREENKSEYTVGVEVFVFARNQCELAFAQVGSPNLLLARPGLPILPLSVQIDLSTELSLPPDMLPPVPQNMLGLHATTNLNVASFKTQKLDRLILLSHSVVAHPLFAVSSEAAGLESISIALAQKYPELPFWLGIADL